MKKVSRKHNSDSNFYLLLARYNFWRRVKNLISPGKVSSLLCETSNKIKAERPISIRKVKHCITKDVGCTGEGRRQRRDRILCEGKLGQITHGRFSK